MSIYIMLVGLKEGEMRLAMETHHKIARFLLEESGRDAASLAAMSCAQLRTVLRELRGSSGDDEDLEAIQSWIKILSSTKSGK